MITGTALRFGLSGENFRYLIRPHRSPSRCTAGARHRSFSATASRRELPKPLASRGPGKSSASVSPITRTCVPTRKRTGPCSRRSQPTIQTAERCSLTRLSACDCRRAGITVSSSLPEPSGFGWRWRRPASPDRKGAFVPSYGTWPLTGRVSSRGPAALS